MKPLALITLTVIAARVLWEYFCNPIGHPRSQHYEWHLRWQVTLQIDLGKRRLRRKWERLNLRDSLKAMRPLWTLLTALTSAPIAFVIWWFRDTNALWQIDNQRKDTNLKDFQKLSEWTSGLHLIEFQKTVTKERSKGKNGHSSQKVISTIQSTHTTP